MDNRNIRFGIIGLGLMGKEFASSVARWCHLLDDTLPKPVITGICDIGNEFARKWFINNFNTIKVNCSDYQDLLSSPEIDAVYCAVPHNLHQKLYIDIIRSGKHLLGEKPFGIDLQANQKIIEEIDKNPGLIVRCSSEFPYFPGAKRVIEWIKKGKYGRLIEVRCGFHHSSDMDLSKPINWKRIVEINGEYGCMGDLGLHTQHIPLRMGWMPVWVFADLQKIVESRPDGKGNYVACDTWDNAVITTHCLDPLNNKEFSLIFETKRMAPGQLNTWFIEVYGTDGSVKFSTRDPKAFYYIENTGKEQGWTRVDIGSQSFVPSITGGIFEFGFSDAFQQMIAAYCMEFSSNDLRHQFHNVTPQETCQSHQILDAALKSNKTGRRIDL
ncbi:MAG: Gfo/Idh/MocA family oxidoreductase [Bacteroidia bacterium]|jgi:predicted dehydrogenase|nr:Gfo/Idh/MocA family oxidoreductase [Bacteroidia bacterium]